MGKGKGQRTKNNARPSNSSRSAELLGSSTPSFVGFTATKDGGYVPFLPGFSITNNTELQTIDPSFQLVFKKMNKKDATTIYKALLEFAELCSKSELSTVEAILPFWPRLYCSLSIDIHHRVRETVQIAHATLVKRVGKIIALYLKQLAGPWFVSQYDMYPPAASAATNCFNSTFPPQKFVSAIVHCEDEILSYICYNIVNLTPQALTTTKSILPEEIEAKFERVLTSSLQAYSFYLKTVLPENIEKTADYHKKLISNNRFWKLAKNEVPLIKTAFFGALSALICHAYNIISEDKRKVLTVIMNSLDETDPTLVIAVWESLLIAVNKIEDWHKVVSIEKLVLPKLWRVLKNGGQNCASIVYPNLLPFISQFKKLEINKTTLFTNFFENMRQGFSAKSVKFSRSEIFVVVTSFIECFRYAILVNSNNEDTCKCLLKDQLMPIVESCIHENQTMRSTFFSLLSQLIRYWSKNTDYQVYSKLMKIFWFDLIAIFNRLVDNSSDNYGITTGSIVSSMAELLMYFKNPPDHNRRIMRVKFSDSTVHSTEPPLSHSSPQTTDTSTSDNAVFLQELQQLVIKLCVSYFKRITDKPFKHKVINLVKIITGHESKELFIALAKTYDENASLLQFYNQNLKVLMTTESEEREALINLIFSIMSHMADAEKVTVLQSFQEVNDLKILKTAIQCALTKKYKEDKVVRNWCKQGVITNTLVLMAQEVMSSLEFIDSDEKIFVQAFYPTIDGDLIVSSEAICGISSLLCLMVDRMPENNEKLNQHLTNLLSRLLTLFWSHRELNPGAMKLLKAVFHLQVRDNVERNEDDGESTLVRIAQEAWTKGLYEIGKRISQDAFAQHVKYFSSIIWEKIFQSTDNLKDSLINLSTSFVDAIIKSSEHYTKKFVITFMTETEIKKWMKNVSGIILYGEIITGNLYASRLVQRSQTFNEVFDIDLYNANFEDDTFKCLKWAAVSTKILNNLLSNTTDLPEISEILINLSYAATLGEIYIKHFNSTKNSNEVNILRKLLHDELSTLKTFISDDIHNKVISNIYGLLLSFGGIYPYVLKFYYNFFTPNNDLSELFEDNVWLSTNKSNNIEVCLQSAQMLNNCPNLEKILTLLDDGSDFHKIFFSRNQIDEGEISTSLDEVFEIIIRRQKTEPLTLLLDCDIYEISWEQFSLPLEVISFLTKCVNCIPKYLTIAQWDVIEICLAAWNLSVKKSIDYHQDFKVKALIIGVNKLYYAIQKIMNETSKEPIQELPPTLLDEWKNVFAIDLQTGTFDTWIAFAEFYNKKNISIVSVIPLNYIGKSLKFSDEPIIKNETSNNKNQIKSEEQIIQLLLKLIHSPVLSLQLGTYIILNNITEVLIDRDKVLIEKENADLKLLNMYKFEQVLKTAQTIVDTILKDYKLCDTVSCTIQPYTDSYTYAIGYLLTWNIVLNMCAKAHGNLRYHYAEILKDKFFPNLLNNIFRLMPVEALQVNKNKNSKLNEIFCNEPSFEFTESWTESRLDHLVCWLYTNCLRYLPVLVRQWWSTAESRVSAAVNKITTFYVSPFLVNEELQNNRLTNIENMQVKVRLQAMQVTALYQMDDTKLELNISLPSNHPLETVNVNPGQNVGGTTNWRNSHMQLSIFLTHQNGSIWEGLMLWKANLDKSFAGVEECYICFSIFHISTYQIPKLSCGTCRKKFHTHCLYKWFNTSRKSTCPICRNEF